MASRSKLYPEILFHFTSREDLFGILRNNFSVSYSREKIVAMNQSKEFAVPMVSFCDLRLSELKIHMKNYGSYGIGLTKNWANKQGLNPVMYMNKYCPATSAFLKSMDDLHKQIREPGFKGAMNASISYANIVNLYRYIKNYQGDLKRRDKPVRKNFRFADEREWRYVPPINKVFPPFVMGTEEELYRQKPILNAGCAHHRLTFTPEDIRYLIIQTDAERIELLDHIVDAKKGYDDATKRRLASRILTADQIANDM
jgi:hypothetical protein